MLCWPQAYDILSRLHAATTDLARVPAHLTVTASASPKVSQRRCGACPEPRVSHALRRGARPAWRAPLPLGGPF